MHSIMVLLCTAISLLQSLHRTFFVQYEVFSVSFVSLIENALPLAHLQRCCVQQAFFLKKTQKNTKKTISKQSGSSEKALPAG